MLGTITIQQSFFVLCPASGRLLIPNCATESREVDFLARLETIMRQDRTDIITEADIKLLVDSFYHKVNQDELLGPIFNDVDLLGSEQLIYSFSMPLSSMMRDYK